MVYAEGCDGTHHNECFEFDCPTSHPVKLPELHLYVRVLEYEGGAHVFADGTDVSTDVTSKICVLFYLIIPYSCRSFTAITFLAGMRKNFNMFWTTVKTNLKQLIQTLSAVIS